VLSKIVRSALVLTLLLSGVASAQTVSTPTVTGALNFRDLGGIRTSDGHVVRGGMIFRSGELSHLTGSDFEALAPLHIHYVFDLRTDAERAAAPTHWTGTEPTLLPISVGFPASEDPSQSMKRIFANGTGPDQVKDGMKSITVQIALDGAPEIGTILHDLASGDEPAIIHCTAGKDRTGIVTAVLLRVLGVPQATVEADYLRSNDAVPAQMARLHGAATTTATNAAAANPLASLPPDSIKVLMGVDPSYLSAAFAAIDNRYGSFDNYVAQGLKLGPSDIQKLRVRLLDSAK
jgi:protein-tyrosine phosphatase